MSLDIQTIRTLSVTGPALDLPIISTKARGSQNRSETTIVMTIVRDSRISLWALDACMLIESVNRWSDLSCLRTDLLDKVHFALH